MRSRSVWPHEHVGWFSCKSLGESLGFAQGTLFLCKKHVTYQSGKPQSLQKRRSVIQLP